MAFTTQIDIQRLLPVINGFVSIPDGQIVHNTKLTPMDVLALIPGSTLVRLSPHSSVPEITVMDVTSYSVAGSGSRLNRLFVQLPAHDRLQGPDQDWYATLREAAGLV